MKYFAALTLGFITALVAMAGGFVAGMYGYPPLF